MYWLDLTLRLMHILGAVILLGSIFFQRYALRPALGEATDPNLAGMQETLRRRAALLTMLSALLLLVSGLVNTARISMGYRFPDGDYNYLLAVKLVLALVIFYLASLLSGRSATAQKVRANPGTWLNALVVCSLLLLGIAAAMRMADREPKVEQVVAPESARGDDGQEG